MCGILVAVRIIHIHIASEWNIEIYILDYYGALEHAPYEPFNTTQYVDDNGGENSWLTYHFIFCSIIPFADLISCISVC